MDLYLKQIEQATSAHDLRDILNRCGLLAKKERLYKAFCKRIKFLQDRSLRGLDITALEDLKDDLDILVGDEIKIESNSIIDTNKFLNDCIKNIRGKEYYLIGDFSIKLESNLIHRFERALILKTLEECGFNRSKTAHKLGISRKTLFNKLTNIIDTQKHPE